MLALRLPMLVPVATLALSLVSFAAVADMPDPAQDAMLGSEGAGPPDRFHSQWQVICDAQRGEKRCEVTLHTADRESRGYTKQMRYPVRFVVDRERRFIAFEFGAQAMPAAKPVELVLDGQVIASVPAGQRMEDERVFDRLLHGRQLLVSVGSFADGPRVRAYMMLDGLQAALADAEQRVR